MSALTASFVLTTVATGPSMMFTRVAPRSMCGSEASWSCSELPMSVRVGHVISVLMMFTAEPAEFGQVGQGLVERAADVLEALDGAHLRVLADVDERGAGDALVGVER